MEAAKKEESKLQEFFGENHISLVVFTAVMTGLVGFSLGKRTAGHIGKGFLLFVPSVLMSVLVGSSTVFVLSMVFAGVSALLNDPAGFFAYSLEKGIELSIFGLVLGPICLLFGLVSVRKQSG